MAIFEGMATGAETQYARNGDVHIAYQVVGDGPVDLTLFGGTMTHVEFIWENPTAARFLERLASFSRLIIFDKRGVGMSDPAHGGRYPTLEERLDDVIAVLDAAGSERTVLFGNSEGGSLAIMMAASRPERVSGLVAFSCYARVAHHPEHYPFGATRDQYERLLRGTEKYWGTPDATLHYIPSLEGDQAALDWWASFARRSASPGGVLTQFRMNYDTDVSALLPLVQVPTLILHGRDETFMPLAHGKFLAENIPGARLVELPTGDHVPFGRQAMLIADEVEEFVTGTREPIQPERMLATVLFTDIVDSTKLASTSGDRLWREMLDRHDHAVRRELERFRGREIKNTGDGFLAAFDGPARAIRCAQAIGEAVKREGLEVRAGLHTGEVELRGQDVGGIAVHIGARVAAAAGPGEVVVSHSIPPLVVGSGLEFEDRGEHSLKGVPGQWRLYRAVGS